VFIALNGKREILTKVFIKPKVFFLALASKPNAP
jgi:hypothetical protein